MLETNMSEILTHIEAQNKLEKSEVSALCTLHQCSFCSFLSILFSTDCVVHDNHAHFVGLIFIYMNQTPCRCLAVSLSRLNLNSKSYTGVNQPSASQRSESKAIAYFPLEYNFCLNPHTYT